jgi:nucleoside-diphosphate-sugar epimerase
MPVLVTVDGTSVAHRLLPRLVAEGGEVRAWVAQGDEAGLRAAGAFVASGDVDDEGRLEAAMEQVHTVVHLAADPLAPSVERVATAASTVLRAAVNAGVRRLIVTSLAGVGALTPSARPGHAEAGLRGALARIEDDLQAAPIPTVVVRTGLVDTSETRDVLAALPTGVAADVEVAPVRDTDLIELLVALDSVRSEAHQGHVTFLADGPRWCTLAEHAERVGATTGLVGRTYRPPEEHPLLRSALAGPWRDPDTTLFDAWDFTGVVPRSPSA